MSERELAAAYVLGALEPGPRAELERRIDADASLRAEVEELVAMAGTLAELPGDGWPAETAVPAEPEPGAGHRFHRRLWQVHPLYALAVLLAALALGGALGAAIEGAGDGGAKTGPRVVLTALDPALEARGTLAMPSEDEMLLSVRDLPRTPAGKYYELWLLSAGGQTVPVASFSVGAGGTARVRVPPPVDPSRYRYFDVSLQLAAAAVGHSGQSVLRGPTGPG